MIGFTYSAEDINNVLLVLDGQAVVASGTSNPTDLRMSDLIELEGCMESEKLEIHWESL